MENNIERRFIKSELRFDAVSESRTITGTAIVFNSLSVNLGGFKEIIAPLAITQDFINQQDIVMLYNHEEDEGVLARSKFGSGSLNITVDAVGVNFSFECPNTSLGNDTLESIKRGDLDSCSFAFIVGSDEVQRIENELIRTITSFKVIRDLSIVVFPAYEATSTECNSRSVTEFKAKESNELAELEARELKESNELAEAKQIVIDEKYNSLIERLNALR